MDWMTEGLSVIWSVLGFLAVVRSLLPQELIAFVEEWRRRLLARWSQDLSLLHTIHVYDRVGVGLNELYPCVHRYLSDLFRATASSLCAECPRTSSSVFLALAPNQCIEDSFLGCPVKWNHVEHPASAGPGTSNKSCYTLTLRKSDRRIAAEYLAFVLEKGRALDTTTVQKEFLTNSPDYWESVPFTPPSTFETVAMEPDAKKLLLDDLSAFMHGKKYYASIGRPWKRGYLLYGPPGTGKSSLIGAMANFTGYSVYDLELSKVSSNLVLRQLLIDVGDRAIVVIEDIDCSVYIRNRTEGSNVNEDDKITLSGLLNFTDGILSACGEQRIFVFTTNYVERLDPALIRSGRMDMHICMSYCSFAIFKSLAVIYLKFSDGGGEEDAETRQLRETYFPQIKQLLTESEVAPADVVEMLLRYKTKPRLAFKELVENLKQRRTPTLKDVDSGP